MERRTFIKNTLGFISLASLPSSMALAGSSRFQYCLLQHGQHWSSRKRSLVKLSFEIQKRCNIPVESEGRTANLRQLADVGSPFFIIAGKGTFKEPSIEEARLVRLVLNAGGILLFDDQSKKGDKDFYNSASVFMNRVYPDYKRPEILPNDHAIYQSYYLLKQARGLLNKEDFMEGWTRNNRTTAFFSHNDLLGAMEADQVGNWTRNMELGGGFRRELCFRLGINLTYYALTLNYKKDRAFPPIIERRRRL